ncbi:hypothetical protein GYMLUDRAFT_106377, partial [Collybiopsis luxurians FD-317 M1]
ALRILSEHNQALRPLSGIKPGFWLPPVRNIVSPVKAETVRLLFHGWLRIREMVLTQLSNPSLCLISKQWRGLLEVAGWRYSHADVATMTGQRHSEMRQLLRRLANISDSHDNNDISVLPVFWNGTALALDADLPIRVGQEIIWELQELGFRNDLVALDKRLDDSKMDAAQRRSLLNGCWEGTA